MKKSSLFRSTIIVMIMAIISRVIGLVRDIIIGKQFAATLYTDAYKAAATIPETIFMIIGLAISTAFLPMLSNIKIEKGKEEMNKFANNIINILFVISIFIFVVASIFPQGIVEIIAGNFDYNTKILTTNLTRIVLINLVFLSINACFTALLQVYEDFIIPSILGLFFNVPIIIYLLFAKECNVYGLTIANVIGNFMRVIAQVPSLRKHGYRYTPFINFRDSRVKSLVITILPVLIGSGANSVNLIVDKNITSGFKNGAMTTLDNAQVLVAVINTVITAGITTVIYPILANKRNEGKKDEFIELLSKTVVYLGVLLVPISVGMMIYGRNILEIIFPYYGYEAIQMATSALLGYSLGVFFVGIRDVLNSTLFSMGKTKITAKNGVIGVSINIVLSVFLSNYIGIAGVAVASSISMMVTSILLFRNVSKLEGELEVKNMIYKLLKIFIATIIMTISLLMINKITIFLPAILKIVIGTVIGMLVYFISIYLLKLEEFKEVINIALKKNIG